MRRLLLAWSACLLMILALASGGLGQKAGPAGGARKLDSFNQLRGGCDLGARLDNFAIALQSDEGVTGYIITYGPAGEGSGTGAYNLRVMVDYLVNTRGLDAERIQTVYGGHYKDLKESATELWLVPQGAQPPRPKKYKNDLKSFAGKYEEYVAPDYYYEADGETGPSMGDASFASFIEALRERTATRAYIVVRSSPRAVTGAWRRVAKNVAQSLEDSGVASDRVKIIFAGYDKELGKEEGEGDDGDQKIQLWILPGDAPPPAREVKVERRPAEAVQIGVLDRFKLFSPDNSKRVFEGLADVLSADPSLRACIIYRPSTEVPDPEVEPDQQQPPVDLAQMVAKWKAELASRYKVDESRLVVIPAAARTEWEDGTLEAWVVPPGAALPDAYPPLEEEYVEDAAEVSPQ